MKVLVIGSGGREHAICWKLKASASVSEVFCAPGNPGISSEASLKSIPVDDIDGLLDFARNAGIDLAVAGPELPLSLGLADAFRSAGIPIFGPSKAAARLESSKAFAKEIMMSAGVPTALYRQFDDTASLRRHLETVSPPIVLKADGLASGKGVFVCLSKDSIISSVEALENMGAAAQRVVVEEYLSGVEVSYIVATDGERIVPMASSHDYKRIFDDDQGPNTGGMGSVCPTPRISGAGEERVVQEVIRPVLDEMERRGTPFSGFLYAGLMISPGGELKVLEFNVRLGDPETQSILRRMEGDFAGLLSALSTGAPSVPSVSWTKTHSVCVVLAAAGYPDNPVRGDEIQGIEAAEEVDGVVVFHSGTSRSPDGKILSSGGRVLNVTAMADSQAEARERAYRACSRISWPGMQYRRDIGT